MLGEKVVPVDEDGAFERNYAAVKGIEILVEEYTPLGHTEYSTLVDKIADAKPDAVFDTLNGDSDVAFFKQLRGSGITPENVAGHPVAWNHHQHARELVRADGRPDRA